MFPIEFTFSINNPLSSLLVLLPAMINLIIIFYVLIRMPSKSTIRIFALFVFALVLWQLDDLIARNIASEAVYDRWNCILSLGWIFFAPLGLLFTLLFTGRNRLASNPLVWAALFLPGFAFHAAYVTHVYEHIYHYNSFWGWTEPHNDDPLDQLMIGWIVLNTLLMLIVLLQQAFRKTLQPIVRKQAIWISVGVAIPFLQGVTTQAIMPIVFNMQSIAITSSFMSIFSICTLIALDHYSMFGLTDVIRSGLLLDNLTDIVCSASKDGRITYLNAFALKLFGYTRQEAEGLTFKALFDNDPELTNDFEQKILKPALKGQSVTNVTLNMKNRIGKPLILNFNSDPVTDSGQLQGVLIVARDVTEINFAENSIKEKNTELSRYNSEMEQFVFVASHDLKEPLRMVSNYTQLLAQRYEGKLDKDAQDYIGYAVDGVHRMQELINDLLDYSRIGHIQVDRKKVDLNVLMGEVLRNLQETIIENNASIEIQPLPTIIAQNTKMLQLFQNLTQNAIKFRKVDIPPIIKISAEKEDGKWKFTVSDNGIGINKKYQDKIFVLFQRLHDRQHYPGTGIGLAVCKKIVSIYDGDIWFESTEGVGTTFYFTLKA